MRHVGSFGYEVQLGADEVDVLIEYFGTQEDPFDWEISVMLEVVCLSRTGQPVRVNGEMQTLTTDIWDLLTKKQQEKIEQACQEWDRRPWLEEAI